MVLIDCKNSLLNFLSPISYAVHNRPLERILTNLIDNALKFSPTGSPINLTLSENGERIEISVQDEGIGIQPEHLPRIFERTFRVEHSRNNETGGSGLGLYIANELAKQIGGTINVESTPEVGTKMTVSIPRL